MRPIHTTGTEKPDYSPGTLNTNANKKKASSDPDTLADLEYFSVAPLRQCADTSESSTYSTSHHLHLSATTGEVRW